MHITHDQFEQLRALSVEGFASRLLSFVNTECDFSQPYDGSVTPHGAERERLVRALIARAASYGIVTELGQAQFVILGLGYSRNFDEVPRVRNMLARDDRSPDDNMQQVMNAVIEAEARRH